MTQSSRMKTGVSQDKGEIKDRLHLEQWIGADPPVHPTPPPHVYLAKKVLHFSNFSHVVSLFDRLPHDFVANLRPPKSDIT